MKPIELITVTAIFLIVYNYLLYPGMVIILSRLFRNCTKLLQQDNTDQQFPNVTFLIAAYNEERVIGDKLENTLGLDYPKDKLEILVVADGSDDKTVEIAKKYNSRGVKIAHQPARKGKTAALNRGVKMASGEIIVFSDANNEFSENAIKNLVLHFRDPNIGGVCGAKKIKTNSERESAEGDSLYWKYESAIKAAESSLGSITGADGEIFAIRKNLYEAIDDSVINDDAEITLSLIRNGYRVIYDMSAESREEASIDILDDFNVKVRMVAGGFQTIARYPLETLLPFSWFSITFFSHKVLRWLAPELMIVALVGTIYLQKNIFYKAILVAQIIIYGLAFTGLILRKKYELPSFIYVPFYVCTMNVAAFFGFIRFLNGRQTTQWKKAKR